MALELALRRLVDEGKLERLPLTAVGGGGVLRRRRRPRPARPRLLRGLDRRGRRQRRHDRRRRAGRGAGHGRAHAAVARLPRRAARAGRVRHRAAARGPAGGRGRRRRRERCGSSSPPATSTSCASWRSSMRRSSSTRCRTDVDAAAGDGHHLRRQRARARRARPRRPPAGPRSPTTRASRPPPWTARPGSGRRATPASDATDEENLAKLLREVPAGRRHPRGVRLRDRLRRAGRRGRVVHGRCEGTLTHEPRGSGGFGYDPAFVPDDYPGDEPHDGRARPRGEGRDQPPRPRRARALR